MSELRIATFNVNSLKARLPIVEQFLSRDGAPDILCFQETKCQDADFPSDFFSGLGYGCAYSGMKSYNGVAIAYRIPPDETSVGFEDGLDTESDRARLISARFKDLNVVCSYVPQGKSLDSPDFQYKLRFFDRLATMFGHKFKQSDKLLWTGDINVVPLDIDVTPPENKHDHVCVCQEAREALDSVVSLGFTDVFRKHRPNGGEFSFWDYRVKGALERNIGWRIDHLYATSSLERLSLDAYVARDLRALERPSDHTAVVGIFNL
jgi:exodeoxyribonuclease-3